MITTALSQEQPAQTDEVEGRLLAPKRRTLAGAISSWCLVAVPFLVAAVRNASRGWSGVADDAAISIRAFDEIGRHGPLVGQFSQLSPGALHVLYDPGPLQYWLLALPAHVDPRTGTMWGSAIWCIVAGVLAVEAVRSVLGDWGGFVAAAFFIGIVTWSPVIAVNAVWNPYFGVTFFLAAIAAGWATLCGRPGWWPVAVFAASVATQAHLMFGLGSVLLVLVAGASGVVSSIRSKVRHLGWFAAGLLVGVGCWIAPVIQQVSSPAGNLSALVSGASGRPTIGLSRGVRALSAATFPRPLWWTPGTHLTFSSIARSIAGSSPAIAIAVLVLLVVVGALAFALHERQLGALCVVTLVCACSLVFTIGDIPREAVLSIDYIVIIMYPVGCLCWLTGVVTAIVGVRLLVARSASSRHQPGTERGPAVHTDRRLGLGRSAGAVWALLAACALAGLVGVTLAEQAADAPRILPWSSMREVPKLAATAETKLGGQPRPVLLEVTTGRGGSVGSIENIDLGMAWAMHSAGWTPLVQQPWTPTLGSRYAPRKGVPEVSVSLHRSGATVRVIRP